MLMFRKLYLSPLGILISIALQLLGRLHRPFMVYGYWNSPTRSFRKLTRISSSAVLVDKSKIDIGDSCWVWHHSIIDGSNGVTIGTGVQIGAWAGIFSHSSHMSIRLHGESYIKVAKNERIGYVRAPVSIGDYTFIGSGACVMPGVRVGKGCIVTVGAVVSKSIPDFSIVSGNPAKVVGSTLELDRIHFRNPAVQEGYFDKIAMEKFISEALIRRAQNGMKKNDD